MYVTPPVLRDMHVRSLARGVGTFRRQVRGRVFGWPSEADKSYQHSGNARYSKTAFPVPTGAITLMHAI